MLDGDDVGAGGGAAGAGGAIPSGASVESGSVHGNIFPGTAGSIAGSSVGGSLFAPGSSASVGGSGSSTPKGDAAKASTHLHLGASAFDSTPGNGLPALMFPSSHPSTTSNASRDRGGSWDQPVAASGLPLAPRGLDLIAGAGAGGGAGAGLGAGGVRAVATRGPGDVGAYHRRAHSADVFQASTASNVIDDLIRHARASSQDPSLAGLDGGGGAQR